MIVPSNIFKKWLVIGLYHRPNQNGQYFINELGKLIDQYSQSFENKLIIGDFNMEPHDEMLKNFFDAYDLYNVINESKPAKYYDLMITIKKTGLSDFHTGLSDFHKFTTITLKTEFTNSESSMIKHRSYDYFNLGSFKQDLPISLHQIAKKPSYEYFNNDFAEILDKHAPFKIKLVGANDGPFMTKHLRKLIIERSRAKIDTIKKDT